jgi:hypothetical protein
LTPWVGRAQAVRARVLEGMTVRNRGTRTEILVRFSAPIRILRHTPAERGSSLQIAVQPLQVASADLPAFLHRESLVPPAGDKLGLSQVRYLGKEPGGPVLELRFEREVRFRVRSGDDFRSVVIDVLHGDGGYAVQIGSVPEQGSAPPPPDLPALRGRRVYVATIAQGGRTWRRLRVGFYAERSEAEAAAAQLETAFPGAMVVAVSPREMRLWEATAVAPASPPDAPTAQAPSDRFDDLMDEAHRAMTEGEYPKAILIYTELLSEPETGRSPEAQELLGLARERSGQLAHAKAEYEEYLRRYPEGEAAERVRQRLAAMLTAQAPPREALPPEDEREPILNSRFDTDASLYASYRYESLVMQEDEQRDALVTDSSLFTDLFVDSRFSGERYTARSQLSGGYYSDFLGNGSSGIHVSNAFIEGQSTPLALTASLGRRSLSTSGVLGRYDGARVAKRWSERWETALVSGFPVDSSTQDSIDTNRYFVGGSVEGERFFGVLDAALFAIHQMVGDSIDRSAIGGELRYVEGRRSLFAYLDYDVFYNSLNIAQLSGNLQLSERAFLHGLADYRNAPILTTTNALQGQFASSVGDLQNQLGKSDVEALAEDRTAKSLFLNLGGSYDLREDLQLSADVASSYLSGTDASGGVEGFDGTGFEYNYSTQLIANALFRVGDVEIVGLRYLDGSAFDAAVLTLSSRQPFSELLRLEPRLLTEYRFRKNGIDDELVLRPGLGLEYRRWKIDIDLEGGAEWLRRESGGEELGWYGLAGVRLDY